MDLKLVEDILKDYEWVCDTPDLSNGKIYKITNAKTDTVYIGSTCQTLEERFKKHCFYYYQWLNLTEKKRLNFKGMTSYKVFKDGFSQITLVEDYPCDSIRELRKREGEVIREHPTAVNKNIPGRTRKEWEDKRKQVKANAAKEQSIPKQEGYKYNTLQDIQKDLDMMSAF